jgi:tRNA(fMet)-specific endonuclease VapC
MGLTLDSSILISAERGRLRFNDLVSAHGADSTSLYVSTETISELLHGAHRANTEARRASRLQHVEKVKASCHILAFGLTEAEEHARLRATMAAQRQSIGVHDLLIGATAVAHQHEVVTLNLADFQRITGLKIVDATPWLVK